MGGMGSGRRWGFASTSSTSDYRQLDVRRWHRDGLLATGKGFGWSWMRDGEEVASIYVRAEGERVILIYRHRKNNGEWKNEQYPVSLSWTACTYGGKRPWFLCPAQGCGRRVAILYGGAIFACRHCYKLAYACQREKGMDRATRRADRIRDRLKWQPGILNASGDKPKGMHWRTYERLKDEHDGFVHASLMGMAAALRLPLVGPSMDEMADELFTAAGDLFRKKG